MESSSVFRETLVSYPNPIANIISKYLRLPVTNLETRHSVLCDIFECTVKFIAIVAIKEAILVDKKIKQKFPSGLDFLQHPSLGHWISIIRAFGSDTYDDDNSWLHKISVWYKSGKPSSEIIELYKCLPEIDFPRGYNAIPGIIETLTTYRNKVWKGHGAVKINEKDLKVRINSLEKLLGFILSEAVFLKFMNIFYSQEVKKINTTTYQAISISLMGTELSSSEYLFENFEPKEIYLAYSNKRELNRSPVTLSPLIEWQLNPKDDYQIYFFNNAHRTKLEYLSYFDGAYYYHKEIKKDLERVFNIQLEKGEEQDNYIIYQHSEAERKEKHEYYYQKGLEAFKKGNIESAVIACEDALEWYRTAKAIVLLCKSLLARGEDKDYILNYLENAFEIDPTHKEASRLKKQIETGEAEEAKEGERLDYYDLLIPDVVKEYSMAFFILIFSIFFIFSGGLLLLLDPGNASIHLSFSILALIQTITMYIGLSSAKNRFLDSYFPLLRQQVKMKEDRFDLWFFGEFNNMFGHFIEVERKPDRKKLFHLISWSWKPDIKKEKVAMVLLGGFALIFTINLINIQCLYKYSLPVAFVRLLEGSILWFLMTPVIRFIVTSTWTIKDYSSKDLKPVVSSFRNNGFIYLKKIFFNALITFDFFWITLWAWNLVVAKDPWYFDFIGLAFGLVVSIFWITYTPLYINRALNISKSVTVSDYDNHINEAFKKFIKEPEKANLERLDWLKAKEEMVKNISTRLFTFTDWLIYFLSFALLLTISIVYVLIRTNIITLPFISTFLNQV